MGEATELNWAKRTCEKVYVRNLQVPNCSSVFNLTVTECISAQNGNIYRVLTSKYVSYLQNVLSHKMYIATKRLL